MGLNTKIQWTDKTVNFWIGCKWVSEGCDNCYMFRDGDRYGFDANNVRRTKDATFYAPLKGKDWKEPAKVFTNSWSDFFIEEADEWRNDAWAVIKATPHLQWQILTKRPQRVLKCLPSDWGEGYPNVWIGTTIESNKHFDARLRRLAEIPAKIRFISFEPLLEKIIITEERRQKIANVIHWAILGGESGNDNGRWTYRPCEIEWFEHLIDKLPRFTKVFVKQLGTHLSKQLGITRGGGVISELPTNLQITEFPNY